MDSSLAILIGITAAFAGAVAYYVLREVGARRPGLTASGTAAAVVASFLFVFYLAVIAFIAAIGVYFLLRSRVKIKSAIILAGTTLSGLLAAAALTFYLSLTYAM